MADIDELLHTPKIIPLSLEEKELYSKLNFAYFLNQNANIENLSAEKMELIHKGYSNALQKIAIAKKTNGYQFHLFIEGYVRKMHADGMLAAHFNLSASKPFRTHRFEAYGESWAYFDEWAKKERALRIRKLVWKRIVEAGALIGFILGVIRLIEIFSSVHS